jgi:integrase
MASIIERNGRFLVRVRRQGFPTATKTFTRKSDGLAWARRVEVEMESGRWASPKVVVPTFGEAIAEYERVVVSKQKGADTYRYRLAEFRRLDLAGQRIDKLKPVDFAAWRDEQLAHKAPGTVIRKLAMLSSIFSWAQRERGWVTSNPVRLIGKPKPPEGRSRVLGDSEVHWLMTAAKSSKALWLADALTVLMKSAMRRGELCKLRRDDIDFNAGTARLHDTKNGTSREAPLCTTSLQALQRLSAEAAVRGQSLLLPLEAHGSLSTRFNVTVRRARRLYLEHCNSTGQEPLEGHLADLRLHDLRHHAVTSWTRTGALSLAELMAISGHKTTRMLMRYTHLQAAAVAAKLAEQPTGPG